MQSRTYEIPGQLMWCLSDSFNKKFQASKAAPTKSSSCSKFFSVKKIEEKETVCGNCLAVNFHNHHKITTLVFYLLVCEN